MHIKVNYIFFRKQDTLFPISNSTAMSGHPKNTASVPKYQMEFVWERPSKYIRCPVIPGDVQARDYSIALIVKITAVLHVNSYCLNQTFN